MVYSTTDKNTQSTRSRRFKGYLQFQDVASDSSVSTNAYYRMKERQNLTVNFRFLRDGHYSDDGVKVLDPNGYEHTFSVTIKLTADMMDSVYSNSSDKNTLSYWIYKSAANGVNIGDLDPVQIVFVTTMEALTGPSGSTTSKYLHWKFILDPQTYQFGFNENSGTDEVTIGGEVISIQDVKRSTTKTPT